MAILDPIVVNEKKELPVPDFNKKEVEGIARGVCVPRFDIDNPPKCVELVSYDDSIEGRLDEILNNGQLPLSTQEELSITKEQYDKIEKIIKKALKDGVVDYSGIYMFINYLEIDGSSGFFGCFGCMSNNIGGYHYEFGLSVRAENEYGANFVYGEL